MKPQWGFKRKTRSDVAVDPIQGEFFTTEALDGIAEALVREVIQNSLDAGNGGKVQVRFWLSGKEQALSPGAAEPYFSGLWPHLRAPKSGLRDLPGNSDEVPVLVVEDFSTTGLTGNPLQEQDDDAADNAFYYFFRNVGRSGKKEGDRGRWGLGKNVFPASSRINSFVGYTVRPESPQRILMGQAVLKIHQLNGTTYMPYGYYGRILDDDFALPVEDGSHIDKFRSAFHVTRQSELGLSVVIPFPDPEIKVESLTKAIIRQYFYAILSDMLCVMVESGSTKHVLDKPTLFSVLDSLDEPFRREVTPMLELAKWAGAEGRASAVLTKAPPTEYAPRWDQDAIPAEQLQQLRERFEAGDQISFRVPVTVRSKADTPKPSYFYVFLQRDLAIESHRAQFVREGIAITDAVRGKQRGVRALVVVDHAPLATFLGDSENPAHTEWQSRSEHFKSKYQHGTSTLQYVKNSVAELVSILSHAIEDADPKALLDIFYLPEDADVKRKAQEDKPKPGTKPQSPKPIPPRQITRFSVTRVAGGFSITAVDGIVPPKTIEVWMAYAVRHGNPLKKYDPLDFEIDKDPVEVKAQDSQIVSRTENRLVLGNLGTQFHVTVRGFDPSRDLFVRAVGAEVADDSQV